MDPVVFSITTIKTPNEGVALGRIDPFRRVQRLLRGSIEAVLEARGGPTLCIGFSFIVSSILTSQSQSYTAVSASY